MSKIFWNHAEKKNLAIAVSMYLDNHSECSLIEAINTIQPAVLTPDRYRKITSNSSIDWLRSELLVIKEIKLSKSRINDIPVEDSIPPVTKTAGPNPVGFTIDELMKELSSSLIKPIMSEIDNIKLELMELTEAVSKLSKQLKTTDKRKKVLIVGLNGTQFNEISSKFKDLDIKSWNTDNNLHTLDKMIHNTDVVIGVTKFINHAVDTIAKKSKSYIRVNGSTSSVSDVLTDILRV